MNWTRSGRQFFGKMLRKYGLNMFTGADAPGPIHNLLGKIVFKKPPEKPGIQLLPLKHMRLEQLAKAGFNVPNSKCFLRGELQRKEKVEELLAFWTKWRRISLRSFREENVLEETPQLPVLYDTNDPRIILKFSLEHNQHYHTLAHQALPLVDSKYTGKIILLGNERHAAIYFEKYGTPRFLDEKDENKKPLPGLMAYRSASFSNMPEWVPEEIRGLAERLQSFYQEFRPMTVEFSIYPYSVGIYEEQEILWEWCGGSTYDLDKISAFLMERAEEYQLKICLAEKI
jgi:hypothetical protein